MVNLKKISWLNPTYIYLFWILFVLYCSTISTNVYQELYGEPKYINNYDIFLYILFFLFFFLGFKSYKNKRIKLQTGSQNLEKRLNKAYKMLFAFVLIAYFIWFISLILTYGIDIIFQLSQNLTGYYSMFKSDGGRISGITTFTEVGIVVAPLGCYLWLKYHIKYIKWTLFILLLLAVFRAAIFAERLAIIEIVVPSAVIFIMFAKRKRTKILSTLPLVGILVLFVLFGVFEYFRSWTYYKAIYNGDFYQFVIDRVLGYYSVAINTECIQVNFLSPPYFPKYTLEWLWQIPGFSLIRESIINSSVDFLSEYGNPEFNNPGGLLSSYNDFGYWGLIVNFIFGYQAKKYYNGFIQRDIFSSIVYSVFVLCMFELPRYFFFGSRRAFFVLIAFVILSLIIKKRNAYGNC